MLAAQVPVFRQLFDSRRADRVIPSSIIQQTRLLPQHASQCRPTQMLLTPSRIHGSEEGLSVESRRRNHRILLLSILPLRLLLLLGIFRARLRFSRGVNGTRMEVRPGSNCQRMGRRWAFSAALSFPSSPLAAMKVCQCRHSVSSVGSICFGQTLKGVATPTCVTHNDNRVMSHRKAGIFSRATTVFLKV